MMTHKDRFAVQLQAFTQWLDEEERKQEGVAAHEEPVLQSSTISARLLQLRNAFEKLNKKKKPAPPPAPKQQADTTGDASLLLRLCSRKYCLHTIYGLATKSVTVSRSTMGRFKWWSKL